MAFNNCPDFIVGTEKIKCPKCGCLHAIKPLSHEELHDRGMLLQAEGERDVAIERNLHLEAALQRIEAKFYDAFGQPMVPECDKDPHPGQIARAALAGKPLVIEEESE